MSADCPELEQLEQHAVKPEGSAESLRHHVSACSECQSRLAEISDNVALFDELGSATGGWNSRVAPAAPAPHQIGEFKIIREIGRGGMGVVYEARQVHPDRRIALKVLRDETDSSEERRRLFDREIRALARLRHPGITAIYGSGVSANGPYYIMEFIEGVSLSEYSSQLPPEPRPRLELFVKICAAVASAHQHGVIHRDLKPGNVLVEPGGSPKVLDFGLARITDSDGAGVSLTMDAGRLVGTLAYMSPEQARGAADEIDIRSDVYSLGVILFELLTGTLPYEVSRTSVTAAAQSICESPPHRPSKVAQSDRSLGRQLAGDLDTIILKTLEKSPDRRYQSVGALADDIERYLTDQPIVARPASTIYQMRKFAKRHRTLVGGSVAVLIAIGGGLVTTSWQAVRAQRNEQRAMAEAATSAEISRFMTSIFEAVDPAAEGPKVLAVDLVQRAAQRIDGSFADQPRVAAALREAIGKAFESLSLHREAEPHFQRGLELARAEFGEESREALRQRYHLAIAAGNEGRLDEAYDHLRETLEIQSRRLGDEDAETLQTQNYLAVVTTQRGRLEEAEPLFRKTLAGMEKALGAGHPETIQTRNSLGILLIQSGRFDAGAALVRQSHDMSEKTLGRDHALTLKFASDVATLARTPAEYEVVEPMYRDLVERASRVFGPEHGQTIAFLFSLGQLLELRCKYDEAAAVARDLIRRQSKAHGEQDARTLDAKGTLVRRLNLCAAYPEAESLGKEVLRFRRQLHGEFDRRTLTAMYDLVRILNNANKLDDALEMAEKTLQLQIKAFGENADAPALTRTQFSDIQRKLGRIAEARAQGERALRDLRAASGVADALIGFAESNLGACLAEQRLFDEAEALLRSGQRRIVAMLGTCHPNAIQVAQRLAEMQARLFKDPGESEPESRPYGGRM